MGFGTGKLKRWMWLCSPAVALVFGLTVALCQKQPAANAPSSVAATQSSKAQPRAPGNGGYVGTETCVGCHTDQERRF
jgi:mono/diheme cytochrome c family protein